MNTKKWNGLLDCKTRPMTNDESMAFLNLIMMEMGIQEGKTPADIVTKMDADLEGCMPYQILKRRLEAFKQSLSPTLDVGVLPMVLCSSLCESPGKAVLWAYTLNEIFAKTGQPVTIRNFVDHFPMGFPTEEAYKKCWDAQKCVRGENGNTTDNAVDNFETWSVPKQEVVNG